MVIDRIYFAGDQAGLKESKPARGVGTLTGLRCGTDKGSIQTSLPPVITRPAAQDPRGTIVCEE